MTATAEHFVAPISGMAGGVLAYLMGSITLSQTMDAVYYATLTASVGYAVKLVIDHIRTRIPRRNGRN